MLPRPTVKRSLVENKLARLQVMGLDSFKTESSKNNDVSEGYSSLSNSEVIRRLPHIEKIENDRVRRQTIKLASKAPKYFWEVPASTSDHHNPICRKDKGLWAHTLMVASVIERLAPTYTHQSKMPPVHTDLARSAAILHDMRKNGDPQNPHWCATQDHAVLMSEVIQEDSDLPDTVSNAVASHMGNWYQGPKPQKPLDDLVHNADMVASTESIGVKIHGDVPQELKPIGVKSI